MKLASWNVNSVRARSDHLLEFLKEENVDILCLQELKCIEENFPHELIEDLGYNVAIHGQKTYNGVAIISRYPIEDVTTSFVEDPDLDQSRYIEAVITVSPTDVFRIANVYVPNGQEIGSAKFTYKLQYLDALTRHLRNLLSFDEKMVILGDFNVAPEEIDVYDVVALKDSVCFTTEERDRLRAILNLGMVDAYRSTHQNLQEFSWWDYRAGSWPKNQGMRIDHLLLSPESAEILRSCEIKSSYRALSKPSDHAPIIAEFAIS